MKNEEIGLKLCSFLILALVKAGQLHTQGALPLDKISWHTFDMGPGEPRSRLGCGDVKKTPAGNLTPVVQSSPVRNQPRN
jgi:hypothetical protein